MYNLNEDPLLNGKIIYDFISNSIIIIGRSSDSSYSAESAKGTKKIILNGVGIIDNHAKISYDNGQLQIECFDEKAAANTYINGESIHR